MAAAGIRVDDGVYEGWTVPGDYDPLLAKLIAFGSSRSEALARLSRAFEEIQIGGIRTNTNLFRRILADAEFQRAEFHTRWLDERLTTLLQAQPAQPANGSSHSADAAAIAAVLFHISESEAPKQDGQIAVSRWKTEARREQLSRSER